MGLNLFKEIGKRHNLDRVFFMADNPTVKEHFEKKWGFREAYTVMERRL